MASNFGTMARWRSALTGFVICVVGIGIIGCMEEGAEDCPTTPAFNHQKHVKDEEIPCSTCHRDAAKADRAGMPTKKTCMKCHEGLDEDKPAEKRASAFFKDDQPLWRNITKLNADIKFSHKTHAGADAKIQCATCHKGIEKAKSLSRKLRVEVKDCLECHAKQKVGQALDNCGVCHTNINKNWAPPNHSRDWRELHGRTYAAASKTTHGSCNQCHTQASCIACHKVEQPRSHNNFWRERGHGAVAEIDRESCKTCHTPDSCVRCHQTIAPRSHRGNWSSQHCLNCHTPLKDNDCVACHKSTPSHGTAPPVPRNQVHLQATPEDCRTCHFGLKLPHPDNGENCLDCHRR